MPCQRKSALQEVISALSIDSGRITGYAEVIPKPTVTSGLLKVTGPVGLLDAVFLQTFYTILDASQAAPASFQL
jgi:hypothetical protein